VHFDYVGVLEWFKDLCLYENWVNIAHWTDVLCLYYFDGKVLVCLLMSSKIDSSKASLPQQFDHFVLCKTASWIELISPRGVEYWLVPDEIQVFLEEFRSIWVIEPQVVEFEDSANLFEGRMFTYKFKFDGSLIWFTIFVDVNLTIRYAATRRAGSSNRC
jgi:hypothetical protein